MTCIRLSKTWLGLCLVAILMTTSSMAWAGDAITLRYKYKPGDKKNYRLSLSQEMEIKTDMASGTTQKVNIKIDTDMHQKVLKQEGAGAVLDVRYAALNASMIAGGRPMPLPGARKLTKMRMTMNRSELGELGDVKLVRGKRFGSKALKTADEIKKSIDQGALIFPVKALKPGDSWKIKQRLPTDLVGSKNRSMDVESVYTFVGMEQLKGLAAAKVTAKVKISIREKSVQHGVRMVTNLKGSGTSLSYFSVKDGKILKTKTIISTQGTVIAGAEGQKVNTNLKIKTRMGMVLK